MEILNGLFLRKELAMATKNKLMMENARIFWLNFAGREKIVNGRLVNPEGKRNFCVALEKELDGKRVVDQELTDALVADGWNVKYAQPRDEGDPVIPYLPVDVRFDNFPPDVILVTSEGRSRLDEDDVKMLDWAEITHVDLIVNPSYYNVNGREGVKAYFKTVHITIEEDPFEKKYSDIPYIDNGYSHNDSQEAAMNDITFN